jgi:hypothetical protein
LTSALDGDEWSTSRPDCFIPREKAPGTDWIRSWVGPRAGLDTVSKKKIPSPYRDSNTDHPNVQLVVAPSFLNIWCFNILHIFSLYFLRTALLRAINFIICVLIVILCYFLLIPKNAADL